MLLPGFSKRELQIMHVLWRRGPVSIREIHEALPPPRPVYNTIQTIVYRLEAKRAIRRRRKIGNALIFEPVITRQRAYRRLLDQVLGAFGGNIQPVMAHWFESSRLTQAEIDDAEELFRRLAAARAARKGQPS